LTDVQNALRNGAMKVCSYPLSDLPALVLTYIRFTAE
jgi:hypothetical protein